MNNENIHRFKIHSKDSSSANFEKLKQIGNLATSINFDQLNRELDSGDQYITDAEWENFIGYSHPIERLINFLRLHF